MTKIVNTQNIALFDLDGTLCDYESTLIRDINKLRGPKEKPLENQIRHQEPEYIKARRDLITSSENWWADLAPFKLGFDVWELADELGYRRVILTQGPRDKPNAWSGKKRWIDKNLDPETDVIITRDKSLVYGRVLVDDFPGYINAWLKHRTRGLVIMPANDLNKNYTNKQVIRYDGTNLLEVNTAMRNQLVSSKLE